MSIRLTKRHRVPTGLTRVALLSVRSVCSMCFVAFAANRPASSLGSRSASSGRGIRDASG